MSVVTGIGALNMVSIVIIGMAARSGTGSRPMVCGGRQPAIGCMAVITGIGTLEMVSIFIICMAARAGAGYRQVVRGRRQPAIG